VTEDGVSNVFVWCVALAQLPASAAPLSPGAHFEAHMVPVKILPAAVALAPMFPVAVSSAPQPVASFLMMQAVSDAPVHFVFTHAINFQQLVSQATIAAGSCVQAHVLHAALVDMPLAVLVFMTHSATVGAAPPAVPPAPDLPAPPPALPAEPPLPALPPAEPPVPAVPPPVSSSPQPTAASDKTNPAARKP
jgi:hypothetical protein